MPTPKKHLSSEDDLHLGIVVLAMLAGALIVLGIWKAVELINLVAGAHHA